MHSREQGQSACEVLGMSAGQSSFLNVIFIPPGGGGGTPIEGNTGRLHPKGVPFLSLKHTTEG